MSEGSSARSTIARPPPAYAELQAISNFSFLEGASHPHELVGQAKALGLTALAVADRNTLAGAVRVHAAARTAGLQSIVAARLDLEDAPSLEGEMPALAPRRGGACAMPDFRCPASRRLELARSSPRPVAILLDG